MGFEWLLCVCFFTRKHINRGYSMKLYPCVGLVNLWSSKLLNAFHYYKLAKMGECSEGKEVGQCSDISEIC